MENDQIIKLKTEIESYAEAFDQYPDDQEVQRWKGDFSSTAQETMDTLLSSIHWDVKNRALIELLYFFAPRMGSFREECSAELIGKSQKLTASIIECQRSSSG